MQVHLLDGGSAAEHEKRIRTYFESRSSGGGPVERTYFEKDCVIIQFKDEEG